MLSKRSRRVGPDGRRFCSDVEERTLIEYAPVPPVPSTCRCEFLYAGSSGTRAHMTVTAQFDWQDQERCAKQLSTSLPFDHAEFAQGHAGLAQG
jgi:hypothetical protein